MILQCVSTTREGITWKFRKVLEYCSHFNMQVNQKKTKLMCVNTDDRQPLIFNELTVEYCDRYVYLGNIIINAPVHIQVKEHIKIHMKNIRKFQSFLSKNRDVPYFVKHKVWSVALNTAIFYGSETWRMNAGPIKKVQSFINTCLRRIMKIHWPERISNDEL